METKLLNRLAVKAMTATGMICSLRSDFLSVFWVGPASLSNKLKTNSVSLQSDEITSSVIKPAEGLRQNEGEDAGGEEENEKKRGSLGRQHFRQILGPGVNIEIMKREKTKLFCNQ